MRLDECTTSLGCCPMWPVFYMQCVVSALDVCDDYPNIVFLYSTKKEDKEKGREKKSIREREREMGEPREGFERVEVWVLGYSIEFLTSNNFKIYWVRFRGIYLGYITKWYLLWFCRVVDHPYLRIMICGYMWFVLVRLQGWVYALYFLYLYSDVHINYIYIQICFQYRGVLFLEIVDGMCICWEFFMVSNLQFWGLQIIFIE